MPDVPRADIVELDDEAVGENPFAAFNGEEEYDTDTDFESAVAEVDAAEIRRLEGLDDEPDHPLVQVPPAHDDEPDHPPVQVPPAEARAAPRPLIERRGREPLRLYLGAQTEQ